jgi:hypothetical protein
VLIADALDGAGGHLGRGIEPLARKLLADESPEVRVKAADSLQNTEGSALALLPLEMAAEKDARLTAQEFYSYNTRSQADEPGAAPRFAAWCRRVLPDAAQPLALRTTAADLLGAVGGSADEDILLAATRDGSPWLRRAAWRAIGQTLPALLQSHAVELAKEPHPLVRACLPIFYMTRRDSYWTFWFNEADHTRDFSNDYQSRSRPPDGAAETLLRSLATDDTDPRVRLLTSLSLLENRRPIPPSTLRGTLEAHPDPKALSELLVNFLENHHQKLGSSLGFLLDHVIEQDFNSSKRTEVERQLGGRAAKASFSFAALVESTTEAADAAPTDDGAKKERGFLSSLVSLFTDLRRNGKVPGNPDPTTSKAAATAAPREIKAIFFHKPGCAECTTVRGLLAAVRHRQPALVVEEISIDTPGGSRQNEALCQRFEVAQNLRQVTPAVFLQSGPLIKSEISRQSLEKAVADAALLPPQEGWTDIGKEDEALAAGRIELRYDTLAVGWVLLAGVLDGVNPCAFATIIFFLSYLHVARRSPREILAVGAAFILAVFLTYFVAGLGLS